jgi:hypothetical protein
MTMDEFKALVAGLSHEEIENLTGEAPVGEVMPTENESRPCTHKGCSGTQRFTRNAGVANSYSLFRMSDGTYQPRVPTPAWAWLCDQNREHYEIVKA